MNDSRKFIIQLTTIGIGVVFLSRLFFLQILDKEYTYKAERISRRGVIQYPFRGLLKDRNGKTIVDNKTVIDLKIVPRDFVVKDTAFALELFSLEIEEFREKLRVAREYSPYQPSDFIKQMSLERFAAIQDQLVDFPGVEVSPRTIRFYPFASMANGLGYVSEISKNELSKDSSNYYSQGDYIGKSGLESMYEDYLRGKRGIEYFIVNKHGLKIDDFNGGESNIAAIEGDEVVTTIDAEMQQYGEWLMEGKQGSIIAIEPSSGEILSFVSAPTYNPQDLSGRQFGENFTALSVDSLKPLFNRPLMAQYRPGSIFKIIQSMVALQEGVITKDTRIRCNRSVIGCHGPHSNENLKGAITHSCNPYFHNVMRRVVNQKVSEDTYEDTSLGLDKWSKYIASFGLGSPLGVDLPNEKGGLVPNSAYYDRAYNNRPWKYSNIYSISIGEGENLVVPLQMANLAAIIANRGYYYTPHLVKGIGEAGKPLPKYAEKHFTMVDSAHFEIAVEAMAQVVRSGTGQYRAKLKNIEVCGKTGTVQNDPLPDHSVFIAFAPKVNPKIAVAVYVESAGQGARSAASIASLMIEKYLIGATERPRIEQYVRKGKFLN